MLFLKAKLTNTLLVLTSLVMLWSLSCSTSDRDNRSDDIESKVEATLTAVAEMATATPDIPNEPATGFERIAINNTQSVDLPEGWIVLKLDDETVAGIANAGVETIPELESFFSGDLESLNNFIEQGIVLLAYDIENATFQFSPNVNILTEDLAFGMSTDNYFRLSVGAIPSFGGEVIEQSLVDFGSVDVGMVKTNYKSQTGQLTTIQYLWTEDGVGWVVTMSFQDDHNYSQITKTIARSMF
jgi:hypothetical protein